MRRMLFSMAGAIIALSATGSAQAVVASTNALVQDVSSLVGTPAGRRTYSVFVLFTSPGDVMVDHGFWNVNALGGATFFNAHTVTDDPLGLIADTAGGHVPIAPGIIGMAGYGVWSYDTNLSMDNNPASLTEPGTTLGLTHIGGAAFIIPEPTYTTAGADLMMQVAQITLTNNSQGLPGTAMGSFLAIQPHPSGSGILTTTINVFVPGPGAMALFGIAGIFMARRRSSEA